MLGKYLLGEEYFSISKNCHEYFFRERESQSVNVVQALLGDIVVKNSSVIDEGERFKQLVNEGKSIRNISKLMGKSAAYIRNKIKLIDLPETVFFLIETGLLAENKALILLELNCILGNTDFKDEEIYREIGMDIKDWWSLFQILIAWKYYKLSKEDIQSIIDRLRYIILKSTWSIINGNKLVTKGITVGYIRQKMGIKPRELRDEEILWLYKYHQHNINI